MAGGKIDALLCWPLNYFPGMNFIGELFEFFHMT